MRAMFKNRKPVLRVSTRNFLCVGALAFATACTDELTGAPLPPEVDKLSAAADVPDARVGVPFSAGAQLRDGSVDVRKSGVRIEAALTKGSGRLVGETSDTTNYGGFASFQGLTLLGSSGEKTITFTADGKVKATVTLVLHSGIPQNIEIAAGNNQVWYVGSALDTVPAVRVTDAEGYPVPEVPVDFTVTGGGGFIGTNRTVTNTAGVAGVGSFTLGASAGANTLSAKAQGLSKTVLFTATAQHLLKSLQIQLSSPTTTVGKTIQATITGKDENGNSFLPSVAPGWFIDQNGVGTITQSGVIEGKAPGAARIYVKIFNVTAQADFTVTAALRR